MILAVTNQKGGVGKTTIAINLSASLASLDYKVLLLDLDPQGNSSDGLGVDTNSLKYTVYDALVNDIPLSDVIIHNGCPNLFIAPTDINLSGAETELASDITRPFKLRKALRPHTDEYDFIIIDSPPSLGTLTINAITAATDLLIPIEPNSYALKGMSMLMTTILKVREDLEHSASFLGVVVNMFDPTIALHASLVEGVTDYFTARKVFNTWIYRSPIIPEAELHGKSILSYAPDDPASKMFVSLAREVASKNHG